MGSGGLAMRTLIIAILDKRHRSVGGPDDVVMFVNRKSQLR